MLQLKTYSSQKLVGNRLCTLAEVKKALPLTKKDLKFLDLGITIRFNLNKTDFITVELV